MLTIKYKGYYIHGYTDKDACVAMCSPSGFGHTWRRECSSLIAAKQAIRAHLKEQP